MIDSEQQNREAETTDRLVKAYLDRKTEQIEAKSLLKRIRRTQAADTPAVPSSRGSLRPFSGSPWSRSLLWSAVTILAVTAAFIGGRYFGPVTADAAVILQDLQTTHSESVDRCYRVQYSPDPKYWDGKNQLEGPSQSILWTRGDRFRADCSIGDIELKIGREKDGRLWVSPSPKKGIRFTNDESQLPPKVALICAMNSMTVPALVEDVLADFNLRVDARVKRAGGERTLVWATLKPDRSHPLISDALLEIDPRNNTLVRLVLWTIRDGRPNGTVTYTLMETSRQGDQPYRLESHLDADAEIEVQTLDSAEDDESASRE